MKEKETTQTALNSSTVDAMKKAMNVLEKCKGTMEKVEGVLHHLRKMAVDVMFESYTAPDGLRAKFGDDAWMYLRDYVTEIFGALDGQSICDEAMERVNGQTSNTSEL